MFKLASYWATIFVLPLTCANFTDVCNETYSSTQGLQCFPCQPGYAKTDDCSTNQTNSQCMQCNEGTYQPHCISANETEQCRNCTKCAVYIEHCTIYQNAVCRKSDSTKDGLDDNRKQTREILLVVTSWAVVTLLFTLFISIRLYRKRRMRHRHFSNNIINNSEYKHHDLPAVDKRKCRNNINLHAISGDVSKGMSFTFNDFSEQENLTLPEVGKSKDENISNSHTNSWKWSKDKSKDTENRHNEGKTNNGVELPLAENQNVDVKEIAESEEEENTENRNNEGKTNNGTQLSLAENQDVDVKELAKSKEEENTENRNNEGKTNNGTQLSLAENKNVDVKELAKSKKKDELKGEPDNTINIKRDESVGSFLEVETEQSGSFSHQSSENKLPEILTAASGFLTLETFTPHDDKQARRSSTKIVNRTASNGKPKPKDSILPTLPGSATDIQGNKTESVSNVAVVTPMQKQEWCKRDKTAVYHVNRQIDKLISAGDETKNEVKESEGCTEIDWIKVFKELVPGLPQDDQWKLFAIELLHVCQQKYGQPKEIDNRIKEIYNTTNGKSKGVSLAYHEVLNTWRNIMAKDAVFDHIEQALQIFNNNIIIQEFEQIKVDPLSRKQSINKPDETIVPWKSNERKTQPSYFPTYALHESKVDSPNAFKGESQQRYLQVSRTGANALPFVNEQSLPGQSTHVKNTRLRYKDLSRKQTLRRRTEIIRKRHHLVKSKTNMKLKADKRVRKIKKEHLSLIKKMLAHEEVPIDRREYDKILKDTIDKISKHTNVQREVVSALTFESYCEMSQSRNCERYVLYSGRPSLVLDQKQFDCLKFYVEKARGRVIKALNKINVNADSMFLFITFDGNSVFNQRRMPNFKTLLSSTSSSDTSTISGTDKSDIISQSDFQVSDDEELERNYDQNLQTSAIITQRAICFDESNFHSNNMLTESEDAVNLPSIPENGLTQKNVLGMLGTVGSELFEKRDDTTVHIEESLESLCDSKDCTIQQLLDEREREDSNDSNQQSADRTQIHDSVHKERVGIAYSDMTIDDFSGEIDKELKDSQYL